MLTVKKQIDNIKCNEYTQSICNRLDFLKNRVNTHKILVIFATHTDSTRKLKTAKQTIYYLKKICNTDIHVINSKKLPFNEEIVSFYNSLNVNYTEIENDGFYDFGKWNRILDTTNYSNYEFIVFINDSVIMTSKIDQFITMLTQTNVELYGYNSSSQTTYHYQSYLFAIKRDAIPKFINFFTSKKHLIHCFDDVIRQYELNLISNFNSTACFLDIGNFKQNAGQNIFFTNDTLYILLLNRKILPFIKIKRLTPYVTR
jgi:hypothetical protein